MNSLNPTEKDRLQILANDEFLLATLNKVFAIEVEKERPTVDKDSDAVIGQKYRAYDTSKKLLKIIFRELEQYKVGNKEDIKFNRGE
jgi:hypothetical protein